MVVFFVFVFVLRMTSNACGKDCFGVEVDNLIYGFVCILSVCILCLCVCQYIEM